MPPTQLPHTALPQASLLAAETSPYLRQHRDNPVHWRPWGETALAEAKATNKPILLSVGYAACHWCHVMAHESFEDPATAAVMNQLFVNIKLDREERPDVDAIYQQALSLMGQSGGWPLTLFLTPAGEPVWGGTYFPPEPAHGRPGFVQVLHQVSGLFTQSPDKVQKQVSYLASGLARLNALSEPAILPPEAFLLVAQRLARKVDPFFGGFGEPPKFLQASALAMLWRAWKITGHPVYRESVLNTARHLCQGGVYDHLAGGVARYSTDDRWLVPHFEKMLYDNTQLIELLCHAWQDTGEALFAERVTETIGWLLRDMRSPAETDGTYGLAAALNADSEGEEGRYYVWAEAEIDQLLGHGSPAFKAAYDVSATGNWESKTILNRLHTLAPDAPEQAGQDSEHLAHCRAILLAARAKRIAPQRDDKVLADWNGMAIAALTQAATVFARPEWLAAVETIFAHVRDYFQQSSAPRLFHSRCNGQSQHEAMLDDYANMARAAVLLFEHTGNASYLRHAETWIALVDANFSTPEGAYYLSADTSLIARTISPHDMATPSGNGVMMEVLARLALVTGKAPYRARAERLMEAFAAQVPQSGASMATLLNGFALLEHGLQVTIVGEPEAQAPFWLAVNNLSIPDLIRIPASSAGGLSQAHPAATAAVHAPQPSALVCKGQVCGLPLRSPAALADALTSHYRGKPAGWDL
jgi:uncharacterized protein YyaL (SSP411 family)